MLTLFHAFLSWGVSRFCSAALPPAGGDRLPARCASGLMEQMKLLLQGFPALPKLL